MNEKANKIMNEMKSWLLQLADIKEDKQEEIIPVIEPTGDTKTISGNTETEVKQEDVIPVIEPANEKTDADKTLKELITADGYYTIEISVKNGVFTYGSVYSSSYNDLKLSEEKTLTEKLKTKFDLQLKEEKDNHIKALESLKVEFAEKINELGKESGETINQKLLNTDTTTVKMSRKEIMRNRILNE